MGGITVHFIRKLRTPILNGLNTTSARSNGFSGFRNAGAGDSTNAITMGHNLANGSGHYYLNSAAAPPNIIEMGSCTFLLTAFFLKLRF